jgi:hypothetical protein
VLAEGEDADAADLGVGVGRRPGGPRVVDDAGVARLEGVARDTVAAGETREVEQQRFSFVGVGDRFQVAVLVAGDHRHGQVENVASELDGALRNGLPGRAHQLPSHCMEALEAALVVPVTPVFEGTGHVAARDRPESVGRDDHLVTVDCRQFARPVAGLPGRRQGGACVVARVARVLIDEGLAPEALWRPAEHRRVGVVDAGEVTTLVDQCHPLRGGVERAEGGPALAVGASGRHGVGHPVRQERVLLVPALPEVVGGAGRERGRRNLPAPTREQHDREVGV